ncbi:MAG: sugar kinase, partial [Lachnospiraceae bacterium]|nr:sugar kinase [Lachnospiraceae bacterium]
MDRGMNKIIIIKARTRLEELKRRYNTVEQARFYIEHLGADFGDYEVEHVKYCEALENVRVIAKTYARVQEID